MFKPTFLNALLIALGLGLAAFISQYVQPEPGYTVAIERSYFQLCALVTAWLLWRKA